MIKIFFIFSTSVIAEMILTHDQFLQELKQMEERIHKIHQEHNSASPVSYHNHNNLKNKVDAIERKLTKNSLILGLITPSMRMQNEDLQQRFHDIRQQLNRVIENNQSFKTFLDVDTIHIVNQRPILNPLQQQQPRDYPEMVMNCLSGIHEYFGIHNPLPIKLHLAPEN